MKIGVSGKSCTGKSSISKYLSEELNFVLVDIDILSKKIRNENKDEIIKLVGQDILTNGEIDSKKLGRILFEDKELMNSYNDYIYSKQLELLKEYDSSNIVIDSMFLPIMDIFEKLDVKILVESNDEIRLERALKRDGITKEYFLARDKNSLSYNKNEFDYVINNDTGFLNQIEDIVKKIKK